jgi:hypothetical protein
MFRAAITNKGRAWLEQPATTPLLLALHAIAEAPLTGEDPAAVERAFHIRVAPRLEQEDISSLWRELGREALIKVRRPAPEGATPEYVLVDPPVEHFRAQQGWGGKRHGAGARPRDPEGRVRVQRSITIGPDTHAAILAAQRKGETYSQTLERLIHAATQPV